jgi:hypothetical protein
VAAGLVPVAASIRVLRFMPLHESSSLTNDKVCGAVAGVAEDTAMNAQTPPKVAMPIREGFVTT